MDTILTEWAPPHTHLPGDTAATYHVISKIELTPYLITSFVIFPINSIRLKNKSYCACLHSELLNIYINVYGFIFSSGVKRICNAQELISQDTYIPKNILPYSFIAFLFRLYSHILTNMNSISSILKRYVLPRTLMTWKFETCRTKI